LTLPAALYQNRVDASGKETYWDTSSVHDLSGGDAPSLRSTERLLEKAGIFPESLKLEDVRDENGKPPTELVRDFLEGEAKRKRWHSVVVQRVDVPGHGHLLFANDGRGARRWIWLADLSQDALKTGTARLTGGKVLLVWPHGTVAADYRQLAIALKENEYPVEDGGRVRLATNAYFPPQPDVTHGARRVRSLDSTVTHLDRLEAEAIHIMREVVAQAENPVMLYSIGKDSGVMLHLARKAFWPSPPPFPLLHVDTRWKFRDMYLFRDAMAKEMGMELLVHINPEGVEKDINPFDHGSALHTDIMKTVGLKQALDHHRFDVAFGGARRDEEKSRAKERVFSFRNSAHSWDPKNQRPELWNLYNGYKQKGESIRVFPLSNWTELDIWQYIWREQIPIVPLYFAAERPVIERDGMLLMVDDDRMRIFPGEKIEMRRIRFRTLGCYPLTGAFESDAADLSSIVLELLQSRTSERQGRAIDTDSSASMEKKKREGYF
jgi:sulfate adenylyltransferase subunit 2